MLRLPNPSPSFRRPEWYTALDHQPQRPVQADARRSAGLALGGLLDVPAMRAATKDLKLSDVSEFTTSCNFCSCGCGMIAAVRDGKL